MKQAQEHGARIPKPDTRPQAGIPVSEGHTRTVGSKPERAADVQMERTPV